MPISEARLRWFEQLNYGPASLSMAQVDELIAAIRELQQSARSPLVERCAVEDIANAWESSSACNGHTDDPCCHVRMAKAIADRIAALPAASSPSEAQIEAAAREIVEDAQNLISGSDKEGRRLIIQEIISNHFHA